jgi:hypothetical protein
VSTSVGSVYMPYSIIKLTASPEIEYNLEANVLEARDLWPIVSYVTPLMENSSEQTYEYC